jgi:hypothetical protein
MNINFFKVDLEFEKHETEWAEIRKEILGEEEERITNRVNQLEESSESEEEDD